MRHGSTSAPSSPAAPCSWRPFSRRSDFPHPLWFVTLLLLSSVTSAFKVNLPLARQRLDDVGFLRRRLPLALLLGPAQTMLVGAISAWSQCTFRMTTKNPLYRTLFSMASLVISVQAAGWAFHALGGIPGLASMSLAAMAKPLLGAAARTSSATRR